MISSRTRLGVGVKIAAMRCRPGRGSDGGNGSSLATRLTIGSKGRRSVVYQRGGRRQARGVVRVWAVQSNGDDGDGEGRSPSNSNSGARLPVVPVTRPDRLTPEEARKRRNWTIAFFGVVLGFQLLFGGNSQVQELQIGGVYGDPNAIKQDRYGNISVDYDKIEAVDIYAPDGQQYVTDINGKPFSVWEAHNAVTGQAVPVLADNKGNLYQILDDGVTVAPIVDENGNTFSVADFIARMKSASAVSKGELAQRIQDYESYMKQLETMGK